MEEKQHREMIFISEVGRFLFRGFSIELMSGDIKKVEPEEFHNHYRKLVDNEFWAGSYDKYLKIIDRDGGET